MAFKKIAGSLSLQRCTLVSDGAFYNLDKNGNLTPLNVLYHGIRGTQNVAGNTEKGSAAGTSVARQVSNIQSTESAKIDSDSMLVVKWNLRLIDLKNSLYGFNSKAGADKSEEKEFIDAYFNFIDKAKKSDGLVEVLHRYVRNVVNGRWLFKNRMISRNTTINITFEKNDGKKCNYTFNALDFDLKTFGDYSADEKAIVEFLMQSITGEAVTGSLKVEAIVDVDMGNVEVYPSQNYLEDKPKGFSRSLYQLNPVRPEYTSKSNQILGQAALRDQKIGNALRTIDTWYGDFEQNGCKPIAIEPNGANLETNVFYRVGKDKLSAFDIIKTIDELDPNSEKGMFMIAAIIRGGVYAEGEK